MGDREGVTFGCEDEGGVVGEEGVVLWLTFSLALFLLRLLVVKTGKRGGEGGRAQKRAKGRKGKRKERTYFIKRQKQILQRLAQEKRRHLVLQLPRLEI